MRSTGVFLAGVLLLFPSGLGLVALVKPSQAQEKAKAHEVPGGRPVDAHRAVNHPDEYAWQLFLGLCRQAQPGKAGVPDPAKPTVKDYDDDRPVVWETWALASGGRLAVFYAKPNRSEVFKDRGAKPVAWDELPRQAAPPKFFEALPAKGLEALFHAAEAKNAKSKRVQAARQDRQNGVEVFMNRAAYEHVRDYHLYSIEGLEEKFTKRAKIQFPAGTQEVKAHWARIAEQDKPRYHWRAVTNAAGQPELWGLTGFHLSTRDLPNWFWCDFEHVDYEKDAEAESFDSTTQGDGQAGQDGVRHATRGSKWQHYRLRGTQIAFTDATGRPTILANTMLERGFQQTSSCITCHARASVGLRAARPGYPAWRVNHMPDFVALAPHLTGPVGTPNPDWFVDEFRQPRYIQTDFMWSLPFRALGVKDDPPEAK